MLLIYTPKSTQRITYTFNHVCKRILGLQINFTSSIEEFIAYSGPKISYGKKELGNELFIQSTDLLLQEGFDSIDIVVKDWEETKCFFSVGKNSSLPFDIFSASFYLISRYEEYLPHVKDHKGRFLASESIAFKSEFLEAPVVDIWAYKFKELLLKYFPELNFLNRNPTVHTLLHAGHPFLYQSKGVLRSLVGYLDDLIKFNIKNIFNRTSVLFGFRKDPFNTFKWVINSVKKNKNTLTVFFLLGDSKNYQESLSAQKSALKLLIKNISDYKEIGLLFSFAALKSLTTQNDEKEKIEAITNRRLVSSINGQYLVSLPHNYRNLVELEVKKDFTMVYESIIGFRASTCTPFLFYDLDYEIVAPLLIHPIAMTTKAFDGVSTAKRRGVVEKIKNSVLDVNGTFSMIFYNYNFINSKRNMVWKKMFSELNKLQLNE
tara:strand:- start:152 stop:1450 length:1299 start_codon:yes stop_codon:yes gene_type:complete